MNHQIEEILNERLNGELYAAYLYFALATYFDAQDLGGFAAWANGQASEELGHAGRIHRHLLDSRATVRLRDISAPPQGWGSPVEAVEAAYTHERGLGEDYRQVLERVRAEGDFLTEPLVLSFLTEQFEDEGAVERLLRRVQMVEGEATGLLLLDQQLAETTQASSG